MWAVSCEHNIIIHLRLKYRIAENFKHALALSFLFHGSFSHFLITDKTITQVVNIITTRQLKQAQISLHHIPSHKIVGNGGAGVPGWLTQLDTLFLLRRQ